MRFEAREAVWNALSRPYLFKLTDALRSSC